MRGNISQKWIAVTARQLPKLQNLKCTHPCNTTISAKNQKLPLPLPLQSHEKISNQRCEAFSGYGSLSSLSYSLNVKGFAFSHILLFRTASKPTKPIAKRFYGNFTLAHKVILHTVYENAHNNLHHSSENACTYK